MCTTASGTVCCNCYKRTSTLEQGDLTTQSALDFIYSPQDSIITWPFIYVVSINVFRCLSALVSIFGVMSNTFNVIISKQLIVSDSLAPTIMLLALIDGSTCIINLLATFFFGDLYCLVIDVDHFITRKQSFDYFIDVLFVVSILIVLNACVRVCLGVISSFRIDKVFIRKRLQVSNILIIMFTTMCFMPVWYISGMNSKNYTLKSQFAVEYQRVTLFLFFVGNILILMLELISIWSIVTHSFMFKRSAKLRQKHRIQSLEPSDLAKLDEMSNKGRICPQGRGHKPSAKASVLSNGYIKLVKMVTTLAVICSV